MIGQVISLFFLARVVIAQQQQIHAFSLECVSIVALASTRDPDYNASLIEADDSRRLGNSIGIFEPAENNYDDQETFDCLLPSGFSIPITGSESQLDLLRGRYK